MTTPTIPQADSRIASPQRRALLKAVSSGSLALASGAGVAALAPGDPWVHAQAIMDRFKKPVSFRKQDFLITAYGAAPCALVKAKAWVSFIDEEMVDTPAPGATDCHPAIAQAIQACHEAGGGRVVIPKGAWLVNGPINLLSNVNLHLAAGAHVYFGNNPDDYAKYGPHDCGANGKLYITRWQGNDCLNYGSMLYAYNQDNIAVTGEDWTSILDGQAGLPFPGGNGDCWWSWKGRKRPAHASELARKREFENVQHHVGQTEVDANPLNTTDILTLAPWLTPAYAKLIMGQGDRWRRDPNFLQSLSEAGVPISKRLMGKGHYLRPHMIQFIGCTNVLLQGYQVTHTPFWQHNPVGCRNIHVNKVYANSMGPNSDGFDPESCNFVLVENCEFNTGDDCIAIDAGKDLDTQYGPCQNIVVQNCTMHSGHGGITLGSIMAAGIQNVYVQNLVMENRNWKTNPLDIAIRLKSNMNRGGYLRNMFVRNISIPNGVRTEPLMLNTLPGSDIKSGTVAASAGGIITIDCGYDPANDTVRTRPPVVSNVHISGVKVGNVAMRGGNYSCYQAMVILGPVASDYNGSEPPTIVPVHDITIENCELGTPYNAQQPWYLHNVRGLTLKNVTIGGTVHNRTLST